MTSRGLTCNLCGQTPCATKNQTIMLMIKNAKCERGFEKNASLRFNARRTVSGILNLSHSRFPQCLEAIIVQLYGRSETGYRKYSPKKQNKSPDSLIERVIANKKFEKNPTKQDGTNIDKIVDPNIDKNESEDDLDDLLNSL